MKRIVILFCFVFLAFGLRLSAQDEFHFNGTLTSLWSDVGNWQDGLKPNGDHAVVFLHTHVCVDENAIVDDLLYTDVSAVVTVTTGHRLTVKGAFAPPSAQQLIVEDSAQLVCGHSVHATVRMKFSPYYNAKEVAAWHFIASPIVEQLHPTDLDSLVYENANFELLRFNQSNVGGEWERYKDETFQSSFLLENGQGYLYANGSEVTVSFVGEIMPSDQPIAVGLEYNNAPSVVAKGFNLVGNPFTCDAYSDKSYYKMNAEGRDFELVRASANEPIAACHGVMVQATDAGQSVSFNPEPWDTDNGCVRMTLKSNGEVIDETILSFNEGDEIGKFFFTEHKAYLYVQKSGLNCAIATAENPGTTSIHFKTTENANYTLTVTPENFNVNSLYLVDNISGADINLLATPTYTFSATTSDYASRFRLFVNTDHGVGEDGSLTGSEAFAYVNASGDIVLQGIEGEAVLEVYDMTGRCVLAQKVVDAENVAGVTTAGVYVLRLTCGKTVRTQKLVVW